MKGAGSHHSGIPRAGTAPDASVVPTASPASSPLLAAETLSRRFGGVVALEDVSLEVRTGAVTCVLGDNGAGKSTLIRILSGVYPPSGGRILVEGTEARFRSPREARAAGVATVHQNLGVIPLMSVWRNFVLGAEPTRGWGPTRRLDRGAAVILITHNPAHALRAGDRFVVLTRGRVAAVRERGETDETELKELMGGVGG